MADISKSNEALQSFSLFASFFMEFADIKRNQLGVLSPEMEAMYRQAKQSMQLLNESQKAQEPLCTSSPNDKVHSGLDASKPKAKPRHPTRHEATAH